MDEVAGPAPEKLAWRVHPAGERPHLGALILALIVVFSLLVGLWMKGAYWSIFAFGVLFLSLEAFFLPSRFELDAQGVVVHKPFSQASRPWGQFHRVVFDPFGVTLSPFSRRSWLDPYRAVRLRFPGGSGASAGPGREEVRRFVLAHVDAKQVKIEEYEQKSGPGHSGTRAG
jgi:hypothetical protein